jgi:flavodoxin
MKIAMIVHSNTGNTQSVAKLIEAELKSSGHAVDYHKIEHEPKKDSKNAMEKPVFINKPVLDGYDFYIFASHTEAFSLAKVMEYYLKELGQLSGKAVTLSTQHFMHSFLGGNAAQKKMKKLLERKGLNVIGSAHVNWKEASKRDNRIKIAVDDIIKLV